MARLIAAGDVEPVTRMVDGVVQVVGHRAKKPIRRSESSPACLTPATMLVAAMKASDEFTRGDTANLDKYRLWPFMGDDRAVCVRPRPTAVETGYLDALLAAGRLRPFPAAPNATSRTEEPKKIARRTASEALAAAGPLLGIKGVRSARSQVA